jgi:hypothetical protein
MQKKGRQNEILIEDDEEGGGEGGEGGGGEGEGGEGGEGGGRGGGEGGGRGGEGEREVKRETQQWKKDDDEVIRTLVEMGFPLENILRVVVECGGEVQPAIDRLVSLS